MANSITKEALVAFIEKNFNEIKAGGCADYYSDYGMTVEDVYACETALYKLLSKKHRSNAGVKEIIERKACADAYRA